MCLCVLEFTVMVEIEITNPIKLPASGEMSILIS
jgi:hypothetical protein